MLHRRQSVRAKLNPRRTNSRIAKPRDRSRYACNKKEGRKRRRRKETKNERRQEALYTTPRRIRKKAQQKYRSQENRAVRDACATGNFLSPNVPSRLVESSGEGDRTRALQGFSGSKRRGSERRGQARSYWRNSPPTSRTQWRNASCCARQKLV